MKAIACGLTVATLAFGRFHVAAQDAPDATGDQDAPAAEIPADDLTALEQTLNRAVLSVTAANRSYTTLFDAFLQAEPAPTPSGLADGRLNISTIYPGMSEWTAVSSWAESNPNLRQAILDSRGKLIIGIPYGRDALRRDLRDDARYQNYIDAGMYADVATNNDVRAQDFRYMRVLDTIAAFAVAECYRLLEAGGESDVQLAVDLLTAEIYVIDQFCEQSFLDEKVHAMQLQIDFLACVRDMMYLFKDQFTIDQLSARSYGPDKKKGISEELPWLRIDLMEIPSGDHAVTRALLESVFLGDDPAPQRFVSVFSAQQSEGSPLERFGAAKRWRMVAGFHASKEASLERLDLVYDDWWRRWKVTPWHPILEIDSQYERTNPIRHAAVVYTMRDIQAAFDMRRQLTTAASGTALAAGLVAYEKRYGTYPDDIEKMYAGFVRKRIDVDPFDPEKGSFGYRYEPSPVFVDAGVLGFVSVQGGILYSRGSDLELDGAVSHSDDGLLSGSDIVFWPPLRSVWRQGR